ncbi:type I-E CRISPR-associated protein Cse1/CasA, partial [Kitasatospora sp. NPDC093558]|uniref:type I-E CRISPR-associated protein Cse1/CasA n=1 Tax=Kitasatospora sp. NPDC093558 TaxID=3155201 RepID=UPI003448A994
HLDEGGEPKVSRVVISAGDRLTPMSELEPHTAWIFTAPAKKAASALPERRPRRHTQGKAAWRGLDALLAPTRQSTDGFETSILLDQISALRETGQLPADYRLQVETFGMVYGTQSAIVEDVIHDAIPLPLLALHQDSEAHQLLLDVIEQAELLAKAVNNLSADLRRAAGTDPIPWDKGQRPGELLLHALDPLVRRLLAGVRDAGADEDVLEKGRLAWEEVAHRHAREAANTLLLAAPAGTFGGRTLDQPGKAGKTLSYRLGTAGANFRHQLNEILPRYADALREAAAAWAAETATTPDSETESDPGADLDD